MSLLQNPQSRCDYGPRVSGLYLLSPAVFDTDHYSVLFCREQKPNNCRHVLKITFKTIEIAYKS